MPRRWHVLGIIVASLTLTTGFALPGRAAPVAPVKSTDITGDIRFRSDFFLDRTPDYVTSLRSRLASSGLAAALANGIDTSFGVPLTLAEASEIHRRDKLAVDHRGGVNAALQALGDADPDVVIDHSLGGKLRIRSSQDESVVRSALIANGVPDADLAVQWVAPGRTLTELHAAQKMLHDRHDWLAAQGIKITSIGIDHDQQALLVTVSTDVNAALAALARLVPADILNVYPGVQANAGSAATDPNPFHGGYKIALSPGSSCTMGFAAYGPGSNYYLITAGHCGKVGANLCQPTCGIIRGSVSKNAYYASTRPLADAAAIPVNLPYTHGSLFFAALTNITGWEGLSGDTVGESDCQSGYSSLNHCGTLTDKSFDVSTSDGRSFTVMRKVSYACLGGDSGGPHFSGGTLHGITSGHVYFAGLYDYAYYSHVDDVLSSLGIYYVITHSVRPG